MTLARWSIALTALTYGGFGMALLINPELLRVVGVRAADPAGTTELRAFYGGLELGLAVFLLVALRRPQWHEPALFIQISSLTGIACARLIGLLSLPSENIWLYGSLLLETGGALLGVIAYRRLTA